MAEITEFPKQETETENQKPPKPTDDELGEKFIKRHREHYAYLYEAWHQYDNGVWLLDDVKHQIAAWRVLKDAKSLGIRPTVHLVNSVLTYAGMFLRPGEEEIDAHDYINLKNGIYNLNSGQLEGHRRELYMTSQLPFDYDPKADCPTWRRFLNDVLRNDEYPDIPDLSLIQVLQEAFGYSLTANTEHRVSFWLVGRSGTGKSTVMNVLISLAGDSHVSIDLDSLKQDAYQLADIPGKRVVTFTEPETGSVLADGVYKRLVSQDTITARHPYGKPFRFVPECKLWGAMNDTPRVIDRSDAVFSRVFIVPMNYVVPPKQRDGKLINKLMDELPGIFNWAIEGLQRLRRQGDFSNAPQIETARREFRAENDTEAAFVGSWCNRDPNNCIRSSELYNAYRLWCERNGLRPKSATKASKDWQRLGFEKKRSNGTWYYGLDLKPEGDRE